MDKTKTASITAACVALAAIFGLWDNLKPILSELPGIIEALTRAQLFGFWSFMFSVAFGFGIWWALWVRKEICPGRPHSCSDVWSVLVGWAVYIAQQWLQGATDRQWAWAVLLGAFAGLLAFLFARVAWHFLAPPKVAP